MFDLHSDYSSPKREGAVMALQSRKASAMLSEQLPTPAPRRVSNYRFTEHFEVRSDNSDGENLAAGYQMLEELGSGSFGVVYKAIEKSSGEIVAIKHVDLESSEEDLTDILSELAVLSSCASNHVTKYRLAFLRRQTLWIVMEYLGGGSCADLLKPPPHSMNESHIAIICKELLLGLTYLHGEGKIHRDIKAANVLLGMDGRVKLADFGVATQLTGLKSMRNTFVGTPFWMAPEVIQQEGHDVKADVWSLGITAMELANGEPPHANVHPMKVLFLIPKQSAPRLEGSWSKDFKDFVASCLTKDVDKRPSAKELIKHRFIRNAGKFEGLQELILRKQDWDASRGAEKNLRYYAETMKQLKTSTNKSEDDQDEWVFETVKATINLNTSNVQPQRRKESALMDLGEDATTMMQDLNLDRNSTMRKSLYPHEQSPTVHRSNTKKRISSTQQRQPLGVNMSFGNSPSTVRQFRRVSPGALTPDVENDDPLDIPKKSPLKSQMPLNTINSEKPLLPSTGILPSSPSRQSRIASYSSTISTETKEALLGRRLYTSAIGLSCQEVLNETGNEEKREAVARIAEAFSDLEATDPEGLYHIMTSMISRMKTDQQLVGLLPRRTAAASQLRQVSGTIIHTPSKTSENPATPSRGPSTPKLVMAQNNPHLKSHRRRQSAQVGSRNNSAMWSPRGDESKLAEKRLSEAIAGAGQLEHTRTMADVMFERWCEGLKNRWPAL